MNFKIFKVFLLLLFIFLGPESIAQGLSSFSSSNLKSLNVDELSDDQIKKLIKQFEESGYSESQIEVLARARGASEIQISKLRNRIAKIKSGSNGDISKAGTTRSRDGVPTNQETLTNDNRTSFDPFVSIYGKTSIFVFP